MASGHRTQVHGENWAVLEYIKRWDFGLQFDGGLNKDLGLDVAQSVRRGDEVCCNNSQGAWARVFVLSFLVFLFGFRLELAQLETAPR